MRSKNGFIQGIQLRINYKIIRGTEINGSKVTLSENGIQQVAFIKYRTAQIGLGEGGLFKG